MEMLDQEMILSPGETVRDNARFHRDAQNGVQFKTYELFICGIFNLIFSVYG